jgi:hypothetical protein
MTPALQVVSVSLCFYSTLSPSSCLTAPSGTVRDSTCVNVGAARPVYSCPFRAVFTFNRGHAAGTFSWHFTTAIYDVNGAGGCPATSVPGSGAYNNNGTAYSIPAGTASLVLDSAQNKAEALTLALQPESPSPRGTYSTATVIVDMLNAQPTTITGGTGPLYTSQSGQCP